MSNRREVELASLTDIGCQRENNEDSYLVWQPASDEDFARKGCLAVIADGMGGYEGGQEASRIAVETVQQIYSQPSFKDPQTLLSEALQEAHSRILKRASRDIALRAMGTTCTAIAVVSGNLHYAHIGDSRLYLIRDGNISRLTRDHSYVSRLVESGVISASEAGSHAHRNILTAALGAGDEIVPDAPPHPIALRNGDTLVLSTDGLWGQVDDKEILTAVAGHDLKDVCAQLVQLARTRGGPDNITIQMIRV